MLRSVRLLIYKSQSALRGFTFFITFCPQKRRGEEKKKTPLKHGRNQMPEDTRRIIKVYKMQIRGGRCGKQRPHRGGEGDQPPSVCIFPLRLHTPGSISSSNRSNPRQIAPHPESGRYEPSRTCVSSGFCPPATP